MNGFDAYTHFIGLGDKARFYIYYYKNEEIHTYVHYRTVKLAKADVMGEGTFGMSETASDDDDEIVELQIRDASKILKRIIEDHKGSGEIDLFHVNCEGCEWEMLENIIKNGLHKKMKKIQFGTHYFPQISDISYRYCNIIEQLEKTHSLVFGVPFSWERWQRLDEIKILTQNNTNNVL